MVSPTQSTRNEVGTSGRGRGESEDEKNKNTTDLRGETMSRMTEVGLLRVDEEVSG